MIISSHKKGSEEGYIRKQNVKENGTSQREFDKEFLEIKEGLSNLMRLLLEEEENQSLGWILRRKVRWPVKRLFDRKLKHKVNVWLKTLQTKGKFRENKSGLLKEEVYLCKPEKGTFFDEESEDGEEKQDENLINCLTSSE